MFGWFKGLFCQRCPECKSFNVSDETHRHLSFTYNMWFRCRDCGREWKESGL